MNFDGCHSNFLESPIVFCWNKQYTWCDIFPLRSLWILPSLNHVAGKEQIGQGGVAMASRTHPTSCKLMAV